MADVLFNKGKTELQNGGIDLLTDTIKVALVNSGYSPDKDSDEHFDDITNEVVGSGYTSGGNALASKTSTQDNTNDQAVFDADDLVFSAVTLSGVVAGVLYKDTGTPSTSPLIGYIDFGDTFDPDASDLTIVWNATNGVLVYGE
jgi:hypothetical protein